MKTCPTCRVRYPDALDFCPQDGSALPSGAPGRTQFLHDRFVGSTVDGRYRIEAKLGEGGMGVVYAARHAIIDKRMAMKVLKKEAMQDDTASQRFIQEARSASKIGQANIVDITDFGQMPDGSPYFVMEFLEGRTLGHAIAEGPLPAARAVRIATQIARGLQAAHKHGIVHRDLKPDNVFLVEREGDADFVKIVDFGIAKIQAGPAAGQRLTQAGMVLGTPEYMSPEQATGKETDYRVDEYALGCILYEMLTGDVPFRGTNSAATLTKHVFEQVVAPTRKRPDLAISPQVEAVVLRAMAKKPDERYATMADVIAALDEVGAGGRRAMNATHSLSPAMARPAPPPAARPTKAPPHRRMATAGAVVALSVLAASAFLLARRGGPRPIDAAVDAPHASAVAAPPPPSGVMSTSAVTQPVAPAPLEPVKATAHLTLRSNPPGATVLVDRAEAGVTPLRLERPRGAGFVELTFRLPGYKDVSRSIAPDGDHDVEVALVPRHEHHAASSTVGARGVATPPPAVPEPKKSARPGLSDLRDPFN